MRRARRTAALAGAAVLLCAGCGARLSQAQMAALAGAGTGTGTGQSGGAASAQALSPASGGGAGSVAPSGATGTAGAAAVGPSGSAATGGSSSLGGPAVGTAGSGGGTGAATSAAAQGGGASSGSGASGSAASGGSGSGSGQSGGGSATGSAGGSAGGSGGGSSGGGGSGVGGSGAGGSGAGGSGAGGGSGGGSGSGGGQVAASSNPLAGPGGKLCPAGAPGSGPGVTSSTVTIGNISTVNGPVPGLFAGARYGTEAVAAYINSLGGLCGRRVVVSAADDQFDQATDQNEASTMANSVMAMVGSFSLQDAGIPAGAPGVPDIGQALSATRFHAATNFSPQPDPPGYITGPFLYLKSDPKYATATQHMALLVENTPQTAAEGSYLEAALKSIGYHFVFVDTDLQPTDPTFNGDVQKMKSAGVTGVVFEATGTIIGQLANAMYSAGINVVLGNYCAAAYDPAYIENAGPGVQGTILEQSLALYDGQDAATIPMVATLDQWYSRVDPGQVPDLYAIYGWMSGLLFAQAVNTAGSLDRSALDSGLGQLTSFTGDGLAAPANPVAKTPPNCWLLIDVVDGKFVRDPETATGFKCSPSGFYREP